MPALTAEHSTTGPYTISGDASAVTAALNGLVYTPVEHEVPTGQTVSTGFTISDTNSFGFTTTDTTTSVVATDIADLPTISVVTPSQVERSQSTEIAVVTAGQAGDQLTLVQTAGAGTVALSDVNGAEEVIYTASSANRASGSDGVEFTIDESNGTGDRT